MQVATESAVVESQVCDDVVYTQDEKQRPIVLVKLADGIRVAKLFKDDYERLKSKGLHRPWLWNETGQGTGYVRLAAYRFPGRLETVARLIMRRWMGSVIKYKNGDHLDLRRTNLIRRGGFGGGSRHKEAQTCN